MASIMGLAIICLLEIKMKSSNSIEENNNRQTLTVSISIGVKHCLMLDCICIPKISIMQILKLNAARTTQ
jgi:hypothetical protein